MNGWGPHANEELRKSKWTSDALVAAQEEAEPAIGARIQWLAAATNWKASSTALIPAFEPSEFVSTFEN